MIKNSIQIEFNWLTWIYKIRPKLMYAVAFLVLIIAYNNNNDLESNRDGKWTIGIRKLFNNFFDRQNFIIPINPTIKTQRSQIFD